MKFVMTVSHVSKSGYKEWEETYNEPVFGKVSDHCEKMISNYNLTLRGHEVERKLVKIEVLDPTNDTIHEWTKRTSGQSVMFRGSVVDLLYCPKCGITAKRYGLSSVIKRDSKFKKGVFEDCDKSIIALAKVPKKLTSKGW